MRVSHTRCVRLERSAIRSRTCNNVTQICPVHGVLLTTPCSAKERTNHSISVTWEIAVTVQECSCNVHIYSGHKRRELFPEFSLRLFAEHEGVGYSKYVPTSGHSETEHIQATSPPRYIKLLPPCVSDQLTYRLTITLSSSTERKCFLLKRVHVGHRKSRDRNPRVHK